MTSRRLKRKPIKNPGNLSSLSAGSEAIQQDLVSILISNYNYAQFVGASINSAASQTYGNIEIIVVDDGSTDHSVAEISDTMVYLPSVQLIVQKNAGQAAAMNTAFAAAKGKFLVFLDSDDVLDPDAVVEALKALRADTAFVQFYLRTIDRNGRPAGLHPFSHSIESGEMFRQILSSGHFRFMPTSGNLFVRRALENVFPIPEKQWRICADTFLIAGAASAGRVETLPQILGSYRTHGGNSWYKAEEGRDRLQAIARNHLQLWLDLFPLLKRIAVDRSIDDYAALSLIRRAAVGMSVAPDGTFSAGRRAAHLRALRRELKTLRVTFGERLWHRLILHAAGKSDPRLSLSRLLVQGRRSPRVSWLHDRLISPHRHDWLKNAPLPAAIADLSPGYLIEFGQCGNGAAYLWYGFGLTENWANWASSECAGLVFRVPPGCSTLDFQVNLAPSLRPPEIAAQPMIIEANGAIIFHGSLTEPRTIDLAISEAIVRAGSDRIVCLHFVSPHATITSLLDKSLSSNRISSFSIKSLSLRKSVNLKASVPLTIPARVAPNSPEGDLIFCSGWHASGASLRQTGLNSLIRFSLPAPAMDRFAIIVDFLQPVVGLPGDWRVGISSQGIGSGSVDLRQGKSAVLLVRRGKAPRNGVIDVIVTSGSFLSISGKPGEASGNQVKSLRLLSYKDGGSDLPVIHDGVELDFSLSGNGSAYLKSGWYAPDQAGAWGGSTSSVLEGLFFEGEQEVFVTATLTTLVEAAQINRQTVSFFANETRIAAQVIEGLGQLVAIIPRGTIGEDRKLKLEVRCSALGRPSDLGPYEDQRPIGVCLKTIKFEALNTLH